MIVVPLKRCFQWQNYFGEKCFSMVSVDERENRSEQANPMSGLHKMKNTTKRLSIMYLRDAQPKVCYRVSDDWPSPTTYDSKVYWPSSIFPHELIHWDNCTIQTMILEISGHILGQDQISCGSTNRWINDFTSASIKHLDCIVKFGLRVWQTMTRISKG